jgi:hypothetical protein
MSTRTPVLLDGKNYVVVHDNENILRIEYNHAVAGRRSLLLDSRVAQSVIRRFNRMQGVSEGASG